MWFPVEAEQRTRGCWKMLGPHVENPSRHSPTSLGSEAKQNGSGSRSGGGEAAGRGSPKGQWLQQRGGSLPHSAGVSAATGWLLQRGSLPKSVTVGAAVSGREAGMSSRFKSGGVGCKIPRALVLAIRCRSTKPQATGQSV